LGLPFETKFLGRLDDDESLRRAYSAADVFVCPSEEDNLPLTVMEAMACGTPSVGFRTGGVPEMVEESKTGFLAEPFDTNHLAECLNKALDGIGLSEECREKAVREYGIEMQAGRYRALFESLLVDRADGAPSD
jgi:glycosyltransferase involved in cell wall biosynthesis